MIDRGGSSWFSEPESEGQGSFEPLIEALMTAIVALTAQHRALRARLAVQDAVQRGLVERVAQLHARLAEVEAR